MSELEPTSLDEVVSRHLDDDDPEPPPEEPKRRPQPKRRKEKQRELHEVPLTERREGLPEPEESVKSLAGLIAKYRIGEDMDFCIKLFRALPKIFPRTQVRCEGYYDTYQEPITEDFIAKEYGGGLYRACFYGPSTSEKGGGLQHYAQVTVSIPGDPNEDRLPRAMREQQTHRERDLGSRAADGLPSMGMSQEPVRLAEQGMRIVSDSFKDERERREKLEREYRDVTREQMHASQGSLEMVKDAYAQRAEAAERRADERIEREREIYEQRLNERTDELKELRRRMEELEMRAHSEPSSLERIIPHLRSDVDAQQRVMDSLMQKHKEELQSMRDGHHRELDALRDSHQRSIEAERESARNREQRYLDQLEQERQLRRADQERHREVLAERDEQARQRQQNAIDTLQTQWQARHQGAEAHWESRLQSTITQYDLRIKSLEGDLDRARREVDELRAERRDQGDLRTRLGELRELKETVQEEFGGDRAERPAAAAEGGGPLEVLAREAGKNIPEVIDSIGRALSGRPVGPPPGYPPPQYMPQGYPPPGYAPQPPPGYYPAPPPRALAPRAAPPDIEELYREPMGQQPDRREPPQAPAPPRPLARREATSRRSTIPEEQRQLLDGPEVKLIAQAIEEAVSNGDDPEEWVAGLTEVVPPEALAAVAQLDPKIVLASIQKEAPESLALSPGGKRFVRDAFEILRERAQSPQKR